MRKAIAAVMAAALSIAGPVRSQAPGGEPASIAAHPWRTAYFGDLHLHTKLSYDGRATTTVEEAYRFARGESVSYLGHQVRRHWPLDFLAVADHAEWLGVYDALRLAIGQNALSRELEQAYEAAPHLKKTLKNNFVLVDKILARRKLPTAAALSRSTWEKVIDAANAHYRPGVFTTFIGYEWTSQPRANDRHANLHRVVIFRGDAAPLPFTSLDSERPEDLWTYLEANRRRGFGALAIPHNANASDGLMYAWTDSDGNAIDKTYALRRALNEPLSEIAQNKGQSETHPLLSPNDEFANFEIYDFMAHLSGTRAGEVHGSYVREAYGRGLVIGGRVGINPYKFGVEGGTDFHNGLSTSNEDAVGGPFEGTDPSVAALRRTQAVSPGESLVGSGGLTGVWAEQNTRESIYEALRRKETFATSGTRTNVRFFGGWGYEPGTFRARQWVQTAYAQGVPMGGDLPAKPASARAPRFLAWAVKDPDGASLDRLQIVKLWLTDSSYAEKIFDIAGAARRKPDPKTGRLPAIGNTVDVRTATYSNRVGASELSAVWEDPDFDATVPAVYYLRVLEIPTPRWTTIQSVRAGVPLPDDVPATIQERAWSSPIWYTPSQ